MSSCVNSEKQTVIKTKQHNAIYSKPIIERISVDYKCDTYKIFLGDNYKTSDKIIDWYWAGENDKDGKIDSTGKDAFLFLGESLVKYDDGEWLPSLHIETDRNMVTKFTCSILFDLADTSDREIKVFLRTISNDIKKLNDKNIIKAIVENGFYKKETKNYFETYKLNISKEYENDRFEYVIQSRYKNGR